ncbi:MAG: hypothetical protein HOP29_04250 [Phycisphaerales bacterium]|nr:hypothetical protein [Phycisphaerales bacterium]
MPETLAERVGRWDLSGAVSVGGDLFNQIHERIVFLQHVHYDQYLPTQSPRHQTDFEQRLESWLDNLSREADRQILLELVPQTIFFGRDEFSSLYQAAIRGPVTRWIIELNQLDFMAEDFNTRLTTEVSTHTWYCAISDSMPMSDFCHVNNLGGIQYRPDFRALSELGDPTKILNFMKQRSVPLKRLVLLEDFIGSGSQLEDAKPVADHLLANNVPILLVPLIICPDGVTAARNLFGSSQHFRFDPVLPLQDDIFINALSTTSPDSLADRVKELARRCHSQVVGDNAGAPCYGPFGFPSPNGTGATVVLYSNTPDNTLPLIHHRSDTWRPLFQRSSREMNLDHG